MFIETPSIMPPPDVGGYDDGEFTYDGDDDMVRDVRNYTFNHFIDSPSPDHAVGDPPLIDLLEQIRETTDRDLGLRCWISACRRCGWAFRLCAWGRQPCLAWGSKSPCAG